MSNFNEPWRAWEDLNGLRLTDASGVDLIDTSFEIFPPTMAVMQRIADCVSCCVGMSAGELERLRATAKIRNDIAALAGHFGPDADKAFECLAAKFIHAMFGRQVHVTTPPGVRAISPMEMVMKADVEKRFNIPAGSLDDAVSRSMNPKDS